jgi:hypothetical protein
MVMEEKRGCGRRRRVFAKKNEIFAISFDFALTFVDLIRLAISFTRSNLGNQFPTIESVAASLVRES